MVEKSDEHIYVGVEQGDGQIGIQGPLSDEAAAKIIKATELPTNIVRAANKGKAILKILTTSINADKSKPKPK